MQIVEFMADTDQEATRRCRDFADDMRARSIGYAHVIRTDPAQIAEVWELRRLGVGLQSNIGGSVKPLDFIDDACVPVEHLAEYVQKLGAICGEHGVRMPICCHASVGVLHPKPMIDLHTQAGRETMQAIADQAFDLVVGYGGAWSGEHGDGQVRGQYVRRFFGDDLYDALRQIKAMFDPHGLMNPGKIIDTPGMDQQLRHNTPGYALRLAEVASGFRYDEHGGLGKSVEQCNGVGACRKVGKGTMCPSYMATRDEKDSTRGRANVLRLAMTGQLDDEGLAGDGVAEALELCLSCKACKSECPNAVDMAKMKSDVQQMRYDRFGTPLGARLIGAMPRVARWLAGPAAPLVNAVQSLGPVRWLGQRVIGVDARRRWPRLARVPLQKTRGATQLPQAAVCEVHAGVDSFAHSSPSGSCVAPKDRPRVVLFNDTYANYYEPGVGVAAVGLLEACGYVVTLADAGCCQRPRLSKGLVRDAKRGGEQTLRNLLPFAQQGLPILFLEPSCASAVLDDLPDLVDDRALGQAIQMHGRMLEDFLSDELAAGRLRGRFVAEQPSLLVHGHCHQKALFGTAGLHRLFGSIEGLSFSEVDSGCCGMAGAFGYEHHDLSMRIGEQRLFPAVREAVEGGAAVCANGFSCRHQIADGCAVQAKHWVQLVGFEKK